MTNLKLSVAHQVPGRIRLKIPSAKGNADLLNQIKETFGVIPGIENITVNPMTGSVVLNYDVDQHHEFHGSFAEQHAGIASQLGRPPSNHIDDLSDKIAQEAEFLAEHSHTARVVVDFFKNIDNRIKIATNNNVDFKIVLAVVLIGFTIFEIGAAAATPVWVTLVVFGVNHFIEMHQAGAHKPSLSRPAAV